MVPACQSLHAGDPPIAEADLWLKMLSNLPIIEGGLEVLRGGEMALACGGRAGRGDGRCFGGCPPKEARSHRGT